MGSTYSSPIATRSMRFFRLMAEIAFFAAQAVFLQSNCSASISHFSAQELLSFLALPISFLRLPTAPRRVPTSFLSLQPRCFSFESLFPTPQLHFRNHVRHFFDCPVLRAEFDVRFFRYGRISSRAFTISGNRTGFHRKRSHSRCPSKPPRLARCSPRELRLCRNRHN